jgi:hypothetical protein
VQAVGSSLVAAHPVHIGEEDPRGWPYHALSVERR